ncbi:hypothetical protein M378DRAFT_158173 [Amanita muscaria Koide BX008]|uniref:Uncharacterized protein n=1 Tax=Amanita muscaria (strain Koide BX008) TaxID=946122 RepID=A0A0C2XHF8_AMAMK|nr:hypothetical protein M378DRAFT_158173 [Amanita muscaria Koide BX008]
MSILGEEAVERHGSHETLPSRCCQEYIDEQEDTDAGSANDSGIGLDFIQPPGDEEHRVALGGESPCSTHDNACGRSEGAPHVRYRWSVDETIVLHLLAAMESRQTDARGSVNRIAKRRIGHRLRQRIVALFREIRTRYLS